MEGKGVYTNNGIEYRGYFKENMKHGFGIAKSKCGTIYKGFWENDKKEGWGVE